MFNDLKVVLADIDGTLVSKGEMIMPQTFDAVCRLHEKGILFGLATGRPVSKAMFRRKDDWGLPFDFDVLIGINGGQLWDRFHEGVESFHLLSTDTMREILAMMEPLHLVASIYEEESMVTTELNELMAESMRRNHTQMIVTDGDTERLCIRPNNNIIFRYDMEREPEVLAHIAKYPSDKYVAVRTSPSIIEFMDPRVTKATALVEFSRRNNIPLSQIMAFGDMENDIELLRTAGWGVCLINGCDEAKKAANAVTEYPCTEDGMGRYIFSHVLSNLQ